MTSSIESLHRELVQLRRDVELIKNILVEDFELSEEAKKSLKEARATPESQYITLK